MAFKFANLKVWQDALTLTEEVSDLTKSFPAEECYVLSAQIKRAADSVALNIAEGSTGQSDPEFGRFLSDAIRSSVEVVACLHVGKRRGLIRDEEFERLYGHYEQLVKMLQALRRTLSDKLEG